MAAHKNLDTANRHPPFRQVFANAAARTADATAYSAEELYAMAYQIDTRQIYILTSISPVTWQTNL